MKRITLLPMLGCMLLFAASTCFAQMYTITDLGPLAPTAINTWGQVVGNLNGHAYMWTETGGLQDLGLLPGGTFSQASAINDYGMVAGTADGSGTVTWSDAVEECTNLTQPFIWKRKGGMVGLGTMKAWSPGIGNCGVRFYGTGINNLGHVIGYHREYISYQSAFFWTADRGMTMLGDDWPPTFAFGISNADVIVGSDSMNNMGCPGHAASWRNGVETDLGTLGGSDPGTWIFVYSSAANGVNDLGQIVGGSSTDYYWAAPFHAAMWAQGERSAIWGRFQATCSASHPKSTSSDRLSAYRGTR